MSEKCHWKIIFKWKTSGGKKNTTEDIYDDGICTCFPSSLCGSTALHCTTDHTYARTIYVTHAFILDLLRQFITSQRETDKHFSKSTPRGKWRQCNRTGVCLIKKKKKKERKQSSGSRRRQEKKTKERGGEAAPTLHLIKVLKEHGSKAGGKKIK